MALQKLTFSLQYSILVVLLRLLVTFTLNDFINKQFMWYKIVRFGYHLFVNIYNLLILL